MKAIELRAQPRTLIGKKVKLLRHQEVVPGVVYGRHIEPVAVQFNARELMSALHQAGTSAAVQLELEGIDEPYLAIFRDIQHHPIRREVSHVDLQALSLDETVRVPVNVVVVGTAPATVEGDGVLMQLLTELEIEALPTALIAVIEIDVSGMLEVGDTITVGDIAIPEGVTILTPANETIVQISYQVEEALEVAEEVPLEGALGVVGARGESAAGELEETEEE